MESKPRGGDWRSILIIIFALSGAVFAVSSAVGIFIFMALNRGSLPRLDGSPLTSTLTAGTLLAIGLLLVPVAWLSIKRLRGTDFDSFYLPRLRPWEWIVLPALWLLVLTLATLFHDAPGALWYAPVLHFFSIGLPLFFVLRILVSRLSLGSSQRAWGVFGMGMTLGPLLAIVGEGIVILLGVLLVAIYLGFNPDKMVEIERLVRQIEQTPDLDALIYQVGPILKHPLTLLAGLAFLSFVVPVIEETAKSVAVWLVADRIRFPAQGFALGALSGAGFALAESLSASLTADDAWALTLSMRALSGSMHMLASGLAGWGIARASLEKRYFRFIGMMLLAMLLHAVWNAGAVFSVWGGARVMLAMPGFDILGTVLALGGMGLLLFLIAGMFVAFFVLNERLRASAPPPSSPFEESSHPIE